MAGLAQAEITQKGNLSFGSASTAWSTPCALASSRPGTDALLLRLRLRRSRWASSSRAVGLDVAVGLEELFAFMNSSQRR